MVRLMDNDEHTGPINIGNPVEFTMLELANVVKEVVNPDAEIVFRENTADDPNRRKPDITKVKDWAADDSTCFRLDRNVQTTETSDLRFMSTRCCRHKVSLCPCLPLKAESSCCLRVLEAGVCKAYSTLSSD
jgi:hypothetical protein